jgi:hypothetical protein
MAPGASFLSADAFHITGRDMKLSSATPFAAGSCAIDFDSYHYIPPTTPVVESTHEFEMELASAGPNRYKSDAGLNCQGNRGEP